MEREWKTTKVKGRRQGKGKGEDGERKVESKDEGKKENK